jgi:uncharacterized protein involved in exopolysaccharide biosynthesis
MVNAPTNPSLNDAVRVLIRHKTKAILFLICSLALAVAVSVFLPRVYRSEGRLLIRLGWENTRLDPVSKLGDAAILTGVGQIREFEVNSVVAILTSRAIIGGVVDSLGPDAILGDVEPPLPANDEIVRAAANTDGSSEAKIHAATGVLDKPTGVGAEEELKQRDAAINVISDNLVVEAILRSNVIVVSYEGGSPELSQAVVAELMDIYVGRHAQLNRAQGAHEFLARQTKDLYDKLKQTEQELLALKNETEVVSPSHWREELSEQMGIIDRALLQAVAAEGAAEARIRVLKESLADLPSTVVTARHTGPDKALAGMREQLYHLEMREQQLLADSTEEYFELQQVREQKSRAQEILDDMKLLTEETEGPSHQYQQMELALLQEEPLLASLRAKTERLEQQRAELVDQFRRFNNQDLQIRRLEREVDLQDANYRQYVANVEQARIDDALEDERMASISVVQPASFEISPIRPRAMLNLAVGLMLGVFGGVGVAFLSEYLGNAQRTAGDAEQKEER